MRHRMLLVWALGFGAGIVAQNLRASWLGVWLGLAVFGLVLLIAASRRWMLATLGIALAGLGAGALRLAVVQTVPAGDISHLAGQVAPVVLTGTVVTEPEQRHDGRVTFFLQTEQAEEHGVTKPASGTVYVSLAAAALAHAAVPDYGDRLTLGGLLVVPTGATNPGAFSWRAYLARRSIWCELNIKRPGGLIHTGGSTLNPFLRLAWAIHSDVLSAVQANLSPVQAAVLSGILFGQRTDLPPDLMADFVHTGTVHILASAGLHVGVVAFWALWLCERLTLPRKASSLIVIGVLCLYTSMAGGRPSVTRAVVMACIYFGAFLFEREPDLPTTLAAAALFILLMQPTALFEAGFQLSFATVLTLVLGMPVWQGWWQPRLERHIPLRFLRHALWWALEMAGLSLLAQIGSLPIVALNYNEISLSGFAANTLVVPMLFFIIPLGLLGAVLYHLWPIGGAVLLHSVGYGLSYIACVVQWFGEGTLAYQAIRTPTPERVVAYYALLFGLMYWLAPKNAPLKMLQGAID